MGRRVAWLLIVLAACAEGEPVGSGSGALAGRELVAGPIEVGPEGTDVRLPRDMRVVSERGVSLPPEPVLAGALTRTGVAWVTVRGALLVEDASGVRTIAQDVLPEIAVAPDGLLIAYAKGPGQDAGVWVRGAAGGAPRRVTYGLAVADRPLFVSDDELVVIGARAGGVAGVWVVRPRDFDPSPRAMTNASLRAGQPLGGSFVPPPATHESMRIEDGALVYDDGESMQRVVLR